MTTDDEALVRHAQHDPQAFATLYDRYIDRVYSYALRRAGDEVIAQDVTSATFEKALRHLRQFRWQGRSFCAWLYRIAHNEIIAFHRKQKFLAVFPAGQAHPARVEAEVERRQQGGEMRMILKRLSEMDREILMLRFYEDLSSDEIAVVLGCRTNTVYVRIHRALRRLRAEVERADETAGEAFEGE